ncbi:hypothetical protein KPL76_07145 [Subtercola sp. PAMC28395]|uniref:hypothetical protein n=1 Tax=Subtercola sp. PAMC28395 TaxID=2846775 RepID=UPI001C0C4E16|nr:hypothetical protein [Subtercola sp. PAMC28395]QWT25112.1 hypothetical protein KPL76_07145 [Subtercola sp. PAMC28395]
MDPNSVRNFIGRHIAERTATSDVGMNPQEFGVGSQCPTHGDPKRFHSDMHILLGSVTKRREIEGKAKAYRIHSSKLGASVRDSNIGIVKRIYAGLLLPFPNSPQGKSLNVRTNTYARAALVTLGLILTERGEGRDSGMISQADIAARLGWRNNTVLDALRFLESQSLIVRLDNRQGCGGVTSMYRLTKPADSRIGSVERFSWSVEQFYGDSSKGDNIRADENAGVSS